MPHARVVALRHRFAASADLAGDEADSADFAAVETVVQRLQGALGPVNTCMIAALLPEIRPGKARGAKFSGTK